MAMYGLTYSLYHPQGIVWRCLIVSMIAIFCYANIAIYFHHKTSEHQLINCIQHHIIIMIFRFQ